MLEVNNSILEALEQSRNKLSDEAINHIKKYLLTQLHPDGGFVDRAGNQDPYYSVFGYTLAFVFDLDISIEKQLSFLQNILRVGRSWYLAWLITKRSGVRVPHSLLKSNWAMHN